MKTEHYIVEAFAPPARGAHFAAVDPVTEREFGQVAARDAADIDRAVRAARAAFDSREWSDLPFPERANALRRIAKGIRIRLKKLAALQTRDIGKPLPEAERDIEDTAF